MMYREYSNGGKHFYHLFNIFWYSYKANDSDEFFDFLKTKVKPDVNSTLPNLTEDVEMV